MVPGPAGEACPHPPRTVPADTDRGVLRARRQARVRAEPRLVDGPRVAEDHGTERSCNVFQRQLPPRIRFLRR